MTLTCTPTKGYHPLESHLGLQCRKAASNILTTTTNVQRELVPEEKICGNIYEIQGFAWC